MRILFLAACLASLAGSSWAGTAKLPPDAVLIGEDTAKTAPARLAIDAADIVGRVHRNDAQGAYARLAAIDDPLQFELTAARAIDALQAQPAGAVDAFLALLEAAPVRVFRRHEETAADWFLPVFDIPVRAASARRVIARVQARDATLADLRRDGVPALSTAKSAQDSQAIADAIELADDALVADLSSAALRGDVELSSAAWAALARRSSQAEVLVAVLKKAEPVDVLPLFEHLPKRLPDDVALAWLGEASGDPRYASAAVMAMGALAANSDAALRELEKRLDTPDTGASAAAALAQLDRADRLARLDRLIANADSPVALTNLALALRLDGSDAALKRLDSLRSHPRLPAAAKAELQP
jgi:hypothetical protein